MSVRKSRVYKLHDFSVFFTASLSVSALGIAAWAALSGNEHSCATVHWFAFVSVFFGLLNAFLACGGSVRRTDLFYFVRFFGRHHSVNDDKKVSNRASSRKLA